MKRERKTTYSFIDLTHPKRPLVQHRTAPKATTRARQRLAARDEYTTRRGREEEVSGGSFGWGSGKGGREQEGMKG